MPMLEPRTKDLKFPDFSEIRKNHENCEISLLVSLTVRTLPYVSLWEDSF